MNQDNKIKNQSFIPVILGANIGVYSSARTFHEAYGSKSITISRELIGPIKHSAILQTVIEPGMEEPNMLVNCLDKIDQAYPGLPKILIGSIDWHIEMIANIKEQLGDNWVVPYPSLETLRRVTNKANFYKLCEELGVDYPKYVSFEALSAEDLELPFDFPMVIKPAFTISYEVIQFPGKKKVYIVNNRKELEDTISLVRKAEYMEELIIQEFVPGDDTSMHILTLYSAQDGETKLGSFGQTLLEDHTPNGIGNPVAIRTFKNEEVIEQAKRIVEHVGFAGFSNFDLKYDERDNKYKFFELNPRLGRSNYYVTAEGHNTTQYYVKDYVSKESLDFSIAENEILYSIVPRRLLLKHIKQQELRAQVKKLYRSRRAKNPMNYFPIEKNIFRLFYVFASTFNFYKKFKRYPPL